MTLVDADIANDQDLQHCLVGCQTMIQIISGGHQRTSASYAVWNEKGNATSVQVLVAHGNTVTLVDADAANDQELQHGPIRRLAVAPNGQFLAAFTDEGKLIVWTADFGKFLSEFATQSDSPPEQLAWCGTDSVVLFWEVSPLQKFPSWAFSMESTRVINADSWPKSGIDQLNKLTTSLSTAALQAGEITWWHGVLWVLICGSACAGHPLDGGAIWRLGEVQSG